MVKASSSISEAPSTKENSRIFLSMGGAKSSFLMEINTMAHTPWVNLTVKANIAGRMEIVTKGTSRKVQDQAGESSEERVEKPTKAISKTI